MKSFVVDLVFFSLNLGSIFNEISCIRSGERTTSNTLRSNLYKTKFVLRFFFQKINYCQFDDFLLVKTEDLSSDSIPRTPCPEFSKFLYFIFAPTLIYRDSYPLTSSVRWKYVLSQLSQFVGAAFFGYYLFYRFCLPVFRHFNSEHVTVKIFVLSILNCTLPGALLLFCGRYICLNTKKNKGVF